MFCWRYIIYKETAVSIEYAWNPSHWNTDVLTSQMNLNILNWATFALQTSIQHKKSKRERQIIVRLLSSLSKISQKEVAWSFSVCICFHWLNFYLVFTNEKGELAMLTTKHSLLVSYTTQKVCFLTTNYGHNKFAELQIKKFAKLHWRFAFLPQVMVICHHGATKHIFLITQALVTCFEG